MSSRGTVLCCVKIEVASQMFRQPRFPAPGFSRLTPKPPNMYNRLPNKLLNSSSAAASDPKPLILVFNCSTPFVTSRSSTPLSMAAVRRTRVVALVTMRRCLLGAKGDALSFGLILMYVDGCGVDSFSTTLDVVDVRDLVLDLVLDVFNGLVLLEERCPSLRDDVPPS